jgi:hypothetical protein
MNRTLSTWFSLFGGLFIALPLMAQDLGTDFAKERELLLSNKQMNQFFRRFNGEEKASGDRLFPENKEYRSPKLRQLFLPMLFDQQSGISSTLRKTFIDKVQDAPFYLSLHGGLLYAEVLTHFYIDGLMEKVTLVLTLQEEKIGSKWVISAAFSPVFQQPFDADTSRYLPFMHPLSHELEFMTLRKAFEDPTRMRPFVSAQFAPNQLSILLWEVKRKRARFQTILGVKFHCFQVPGYYFSIAQHIRPGENSGWLISTLAQSTPEAPALFLETLATP